jgi:RNA polymerase sigma factor (sigma-70 family)
LNNAEQELVIQLQQGNEAAFRKLVDAYEKLVYNTALGIVQNEEDADDITQEVFIQAYQSVTDFKGASKISTWLYRITLGKALDLEKKKKRKKRFGFVQALFGSSGEETVPAVEFDHPGVQLEKKESAASLFKALKQLPDNQRIAFTLHKMEGRSYNEVAEIMDTTVTAVESLMARGKTNLKKILSTYYESKFNN